MSTAVLLDDDDNDFLEWRYRDIPGETKADRQARLKRETRRLRLEEECLARGEPPPLPTPDLIAEVEHLIGFDQPQSIAARLGYSNPDSLATRLRNNGRADLANHFDWRRLSGSRKKLNRPGVDAERSIIS